MNKKKNRPHTGKKKQAPSPHTKAGRAHTRDPRPISLSRKNGYFLFGRNSVEAALKNPNRHCIRLIGTEKSLRDTLNVTETQMQHKNVTLESHENSHQIAASVPAGAPHQGILLEVLPLPQPDIQDLTPYKEKKNIILILDQVTDPHNVGACLRSAAALGAKALITQDKNSPAENGVIARAAAGGLETLPWLRVANISQTIDILKEYGYWHIGLDGNTDQSIRSLSLGDNIVIVMGSEGKGLRPLVRKNCDMIAKIPMTGMVESLNVSNAAAIALYELSK